MTEPEAPTVPVTEGEETPAETTAETTTAKSGSGRPRPQSTLDRDAKVLAYLSEQTEGKSKEDIAASLEMPANEVYLSLWRLKRDKQIHKVSSGGAARWVAGEAPTSTEEVNGDASSSEPAAAPAEESVAI